ncbi:MAG: DUF192 domain-containing protein [Cyclonatronaceae bacterium]
MRKIPLTLVLLIIFAVSYCSGSNKGDSQDRRTGRTINPTDTIQILTAQQDRVVAEIRVALARTETERNTGLMEVQEMPFDTGMLFIFDDESSRSFWMANTPLSLDILFADRQRRIVRIHTRTTPYSDRQIRSEYPAMYTLEVNAGFVNDHDIREGMYLHWE